MRQLELLAPAKNLECGMAAIDHGADAVYMGAARYGARAAAGNSVADIARLCDYAHVFGAKVYVTVNTIIYDDELDDIRRLLAELAEARVDAILVQDMAIPGMVASSAEAACRSMPAPRPTIAHPRRCAGCEGWGLAGWCLPANCRSVKSRLSMRLFPM